MQFRKFNWISLYQQQQRAVCRQEKEGKNLMSSRQNQWKQDLLYATAVVACYYYFNINDFYMNKKLFIASV
jgi:hypothetical protein